MISNSITVYCQHGDERFGALAAQELNNLNQPTLLGNAEAFLKSARYIEHDLNRSYEPGVSCTCYEHQRATEILAVVSEYKLVIDIHTTQANVGKIAIVPSNSNELFRLALVLGFNIVAVMPASLVSASLIGNVPLGISLEYGANTDTSEATAADLSKRIGKLSKIQRTGKIKAYYIKGLIDAELRGKGLRNYKYSNKIGGYPILVGESRYKTHAGFFADKVENVMIEERNE